ncbi:MAG: hypothetical protein NT141_00485 [candidate division WWE3 bacterium]|nr:hypothetical protein [candidate division WWE3 bacterium]
MTKNFAKEDTKNTTEQRGYVDSVKGLSQTLSRQVAEELREKKYAGTKDVLELVGDGAFLMASLVAPKFSTVFKSLIKDQDAPEPWRRFNIPYLKRTLKRLEKQKLVTISQEKGVGVVEITDSGRHKILKYSLDTLEIKEPRTWDHTWRLVSYDIPKEQSPLRAQIMEYLKVWGFYQLQESVYLHAYPCEKEVEFLREYLRAGGYVRIFVVTSIENDRPFRDFFGLA